MNLFLDQESKPWCRIINTDTVGRPFPRRPYRTIMEVMGLVFVTPKACTPRNSVKDTGTKRKPDIKKGKELLPFFLRNLLVLAM
ncbi:hypothetical protein Nepgr_006436 [Nepenthes gracilis]|uniref:Uncharacterized protein n=1 Tax=Nepenthes gracilis TaxID=150966 RepID=A0AAD3S5J8_NEPGR|nr:hypothetical protein Nepgr_006436 [Nepenthes gracilis]